jgi:hypothetical protein
MKMRAQFTMVEMDYKHNIIFIEDIANHTGGMTITNDAEAVFEHIDENYSHAAPTPLFWRVVYKDTDNEWWEIVPTVGKYLGTPNTLLNVGFNKWHGHTWDALKGNV